MASVVSQLIEEVTAHAQSDSFEDAREICADGTYFPNKLRVYIYIYMYVCMHEWKQHKPWFDDVDNLNSVRREVSRHFRNKNKEYLRAKIEEIEANSKIHIIRDLYRGINDFKKGYQPSSNIVKDEKGDLFA